MSIVNVPAYYIPQIERAANYAATHGTRLRIETGEDRHGNTWVKWDCGHGWVAPVESTDAVRHEVVWHFDGTPCDEGWIRKTSHQGFCVAHGRAVRDIQPGPEGFEIIGR
jgi:hypothetical protein